MDDSIIRSPELQPTMAELAACVDNPLWDRLCSFIETTYGVQPQLSYSKCSLQRGWNVKYKKGSRSLCTIYPERGRFICLLVIGRQEAEAAEPLLAAGEPYLQQLYQQANPVNGARWLMIEVSTEAILDEVQQLLLIRCQAKQRT